MAGNDGLQKMLPESPPRRKNPLHPLCAWTAFSCNKLFLFMYALLFLFVGIILTCIGVLVELHRDRIEPVNNRLALPTAMLIVTGLIIACNSLCGLVGTIKERPLLLKIFLVTTIICFLLQITIGIIAFIYREELPHVVSSEFMFAVKGYSKDDDIKSALDWLQNTYKCCGFDSYMDYLDHNKCTPDSKGQCGVPKSCCIKGEGIVPPENCGSGIKANMTLGNKRIHRDGCTNALITWLIEHLDLVGAIALGFAIPQIFGILLSFYFLRKVQEYRVWFRVDNFRT